MKTIQAMALLAAGAVVPGLAAEDATMPGGEPLFRVALLHAMCLSLERDMKDLDSETIYLNVYVEEGCPANQEALRRSVVGEFLRGRLKTGRTVREAGQIASNIAVFCNFPDDARIGTYSIRGENLVGLPPLLLIFGVADSPYGVSESTPALIIEEAVQLTAEQLVTNLLERQRDAKAGEMCPLQQGPSL